MINLNFSKNLFVAKDNNSQGVVRIFDGKPTRNNETKSWEGTEIGDLDEEYFIKMNWESEPEEISISFGGKQISETDY